MNNQDASTRIGNLQLHLPAILARRAEHIARETLHCLAGLPLQVSLQVAVLDVAPVRVSPAETNRVIARRLAAAIMAQIEQDGTRSKQHAG